MAENMEVIVSALDQASEVFAQIAAQAQEMSDTIISTVEGAGSDFDNLNDSAGGASDGLGKVSEESDNMSNSVDNATDATDLLIGAMEGVVATEMANALNNCIDTAASYQDQINSLSLTFGETTVNSEAFKNTISQTSQTTGRAGSSIRDYFNQMGIAGVTNTTLLEQSFEALSGKAVQTGGNINSMANLMERMVLSGNVASRSLTQLGLSTDDLGRVMGVSGDEAKKMFSSLSQEERLRVLTQAMGDGAAANQMYKSSFSGMKQQLENQLGLVARNIGTSMLPLLINSLRVCTPVLDGFASALGNPVIGGAVAVFGGVATALMGLTAATKMAKIMIDGYKTAVTIAKTVSYLLALAKGTLTTAELGEMAAVSGNTAATTTNTAAKNANAIVSTALAIKNGVLAASEYVVTAAQWALNAAMDANPIGLVVLAVTALVAALTYLYFNNENVRMTVDALANSLGGFLVPVLNLISSIIQRVISYLQLFYLALTQGGPYATQFTTMVSNAVMLLPSLLFSIFSQIATIIIQRMMLWISIGKSKANQFVNGVIGFVMTLPGRVLSNLLKVGSNILSAGGKWLSNAKTAGLNIVTGVINGLAGIGDAVFGKFTDVTNAINRAKDSAVKAAGDFGSQMLAKFKQVINSASPSDFYKIPANDFANIAGAIDNARPGAVRAVGKFGSEMVKAYDSIGGDDLVYDGSLGVTSTTSVVNTGNKGTVEVNVNSTFDLKNIPSHINESTLAGMIKNSDGAIVNAIANNLQFQNADLKMKNRISNRGNRARGV